MKKVNLAVLAACSSSMVFAAGFGLYEGSARGIGGDIVGRDVEQKK